MAWNTDSHDIDIYFYIYIHIYILHPTSHILPSYHPAFLPSYLPAFLPSYLATLLPCYLATLLSPLSQTVNFCDRLTTVASPWQHSWMIRTLLRSRGVAKFGGERCFPCEWVRDPQRLRIHCCKTKAADGKQRLLAVQGKSRRATSAGARSQMPRSSPTD